MQRSRSRPETTRRLVQAAQQGDRHAENELVRRFEPLVRRVVLGLKLPPWCEREDVAQEARIGLVTAVRAWRQERGSFPAFAHRCVSNQALLAVAASSRQKHRALNLAVSLEEGDRPLLESGPESRFLIREDIQSVLETIPTLTLPEQAVISGGLRGRSHGQVARTLGMTPKAASQAAYRARRKLARVLPRAA